jgi:hypothetical protein
MYRGTLVWALRQVGRLVDDRNSDGSLALAIGSTTAISKRARAVDALNEAQVSVFYDLLDSDVARETLAREVALTAVSGDTQSLALPPRATEWFGLRTGGMGTDDEPIPAVSGTHYGDYGYTVGPRGETIKLHGFSTTGETYYIRVIEEPVSLAYGTFLQAETASTTGMLAATAEYGELVLDVDDMNGAEIVVESSSTTGAGTKRTITDMSHSGDTTSITVDAAWTFNASAKWSTRMALPKVAMRLTLLKAAAWIAQWTMPNRVERLEQQYERAWATALQAAQRMSGDAYYRTRLVRDY